ncbi:MAG: ribose-phosphate pyrophosphokinase [Sphingomonadales bacterium]
MTDACLYFLPGQQAPAEALAKALQIAARPIHIRRFPDGESLVRIDPPPTTAIVYASLDRPNEKLVELILAAAALADNGARRLVLVAPYLCYMRQDMAFAPGEAVSQRVIGALLAQRFDRVIAVDPHLHRTEDLAQVFPGIAADALSATGLIADMLRRQGIDRDTVLVGPDAESRQWVERVAAPLGLELLIGEKQRHGDRDVDVTVAGVERARGRPAILIDDVVSSGMTVARCARVLRQAGVGPVKLVTVHALIGADDWAQVQAAGVDDICSSDSIAHPSNRFSLAPLLAAALAGECA